MKKIFSELRWLFIFIIIGLVISITYHVIKNDYFNLKTVKNINVFDIKIDDNIDQFFSKRELKQYDTEVGYLKESFKLINIYDSNIKNKFQNEYQGVQLIYETGTRKIWSVTTVDSINPDKCITKRNEKFNELKIKYNILDIDDEGLIVENDYRTGSLNRKVSYIGYFLGDDLSRMVRITCYDNRGAKPPEGTEEDKFRYEGELRFELLSSYLKKAYKD